MPGFVTWEARGQNVWRRSTKRKRAADPADDKGKEPKKRPRTQGDGGGQRFQAAWPPPSLAATSVRPVLLLLLLPSLRKCVDATS